MHEQLHDFFVATLESRCMLADNVTVSLTPAGDSFGVAGAFDAQLGGQSDQMTMVWFFAQDSVLVHGGGGFDVITGDPPIADQTPSYVSIESLFE